MNILQSWIRVEDCGMSIRPAGHQRSDHHVHHPLRAAFKKYGSVQIQNAKDGTNSQRGKNLQHRPRLES